MKYVYVIIGQSTGCNGGVIQWADAAYVDERKAVDTCNKMNQVSQQNDQAYLAYVTGPIPLC